MPFLVLALSPTAHAADVLILWDSLGQDTPALASALEAAGHTITYSDVPEGQYDGTNPSPDAFAAVIHLDGAEGEPYGPSAAWEAYMPQAGQDALLAYVQSGGGYIGHEWLAYESANGYANMNDLILLTRTNGMEGPISVSVVAGQEAHPLWSGLPATIDFLGGQNVGSARVYATDPVTVVARDGGGNDAVVVRQWGAGRVVAFHHAGNFQTYGTLADADVQALYVNAVDWAADCDRDNDGDTSVQCGGGDCDDVDPLRSGLTTEVCNEVDDDCDGEVDGANASDALPWFVDADGDGFGDSDTEEFACVLDVGLAAEGGDCDDSSASVYPGADEVAYDGVDQDCADGDLCDTDGDGLDAQECAGADCDDADAAVAECAEEEGDDGDAAGCGCATTGGGSALGLAAGLLLLVARRRR